MEITITTDEVLTWGYAQPYYLSYIRQKGGIVTMAEMVSDLGYTEASIRQELDKLERRGLIKKHYGKKKGVGHNGKLPLIKVEIL